MRGFDYIIMDGHSMTGSDTGMVASIFDAVVIVASAKDQVGGRQAAAQK
jgi:hypothetical protein